MSLVIDALEDLVRTSVDDAAVTREDWEAALDHVFGSTQALTVQLIDAPSEKTLEQLYGTDDTVPSGDDLADWQYEVQNGDTRLGLHGWLASRQADADAPVEPTTQSPSEDRSGAYRVGWKIDVDDATSPAAAAARVWTENFNRGSTQPSPDDACVFEVEISTESRVLEIDLSDEEFAPLFE